MSRYVFCIEVRGGENYESDLAYPTLRAAKHALNKMVKRLRAGGVVVTWSWTEKLLDDTEVKPIIDSDEKQ